MCSLYKVVCFLFFFSSFAFAQNDAQNRFYYNSIYNKTDINSYKKAIKEVERLIQSNNFSPLQTSQINDILYSFEERKLNFSSHYIYFFNFLININKSDKKASLLSQYLILLKNCDDKSSLDLSKILQACLTLIKNNQISISKSFSWSILGDFDFLIDETNQPIIRLNNVMLSLHNRMDTISILNLSGFYNFESNSILGDYGICNNHFINGELVGFEFFNFSLNLNKNYFSIEEALISCNSPLYFSSLGVYNNKLGSSSFYPKFMSSGKITDIEIFEGIHTSGFVEMIGTTFYINGASSDIRLTFQENQSNFNLYSNRIQIKKDIISSIDSRFSIVVNNDSIYHPSVNFSYNDINKKIDIERVSSTRGLNPFKNTIHGISMFIDKINYDLSNSKLFFFHYSPGRDIEVLFESDSYFEKNRYFDIFNASLNPLLMLLKFADSKKLEKKHLIEDFAKFYKKDINAIIQIIIELEIFGFVDYFDSDNSFVIKSWATHFKDSYELNYDYDNFKIQSLAGIGDTVASIDLLSNDMKLMQVEKINITNRFDIELYPMSNQLIFNGNKNFKMDGNIYVGNFAFSGKDIQFNYDEFSFFFKPKSIMSFFNNSGSDITSSIINLDSGVLSLDAATNKSGVKFLNNYPIFKTKDHSYFSYKNNSSQFFLEPFEVDYLNDMSFSNLSFDGSLFINEVCSDITSKLFFNSNNDLIANIDVNDVGLYKGNVQFSGFLDLNPEGLFGAGKFFSREIHYISNVMKLESASITGLVESCSSGDSLESPAFNGKKNMLSHYPLEQTFLIKSLKDPFSIYDNFLFSGDLYYDSSNLNASGEIYSEIFSNTSSHHLFSTDNIMSGDAIFKLFYKKNKIQFESKGVSLEYNIPSDSIYLFSSNNPFSLPIINYDCFFDFALIDIDKSQIDFESYNEPGLLKSYNYGKKGFNYESLNGLYYLNSNIFCVNNIYPLSIKGFLIQPENNSVCIDSKGDFPIFNNGTLIKKRFLFRDKLFNNKNILLKPSLRHILINE